MERNVAIETPSFIQPEVGVFQPPLRTWKSLSLLLLIVTLVQISTMPKFAYPGDNVVPRLEAVFWVENGHLGIPFSWKEQNLDFFSARGGQFFENDGDQCYYSKYGIAYTFFYAPVVWLDRQIYGFHGIRYESPGLIWILDLSNVCLAAASAVYLFLLGNLFLRSPVRSFIWVLVVYYTTFLWFYLRAPALETYQIFAFLGWSFHGLYFLCRTTVPNPAWRHLGMAALFAGVLFLMKSFYAVLFPPLVLAVLMVRFPCGELSSQKQWRKLLVSGGMWIGFPAAGAMLIFLMTNQVRYGHFLQSGYSQWQGNDGLPETRFGLEFVADAIWGFLIKPGNANLWIHAPILVAVLLGWPVFFRKFPRPALFIVVTAIALLVPLCCYSGWHGEWCYGPRYLVFLVPLLALPAWDAWQQPALLCRFPGGKILGRGFMILLLAGGLYLQVYANSLHYFAYYYTRSYFPVSRTPELTRYFDKSPCRALVHLDLLHHAGKKEIFPPLHLMMQLNPPPAPEYFHMVNQGLQINTSLNYLFFK